MASQPNKNVSECEDDVIDIVNTLNDVLGRLDRMGITLAGAQLSSVLDTLSFYITGVNENARATQS
ncbi:MAG: hypothetical protein JWL66_1288 [Sphingomonadales bacterium]|jgi:hypothetical protein|nr:hypothetical protein [Sphingomonadales bacterium]